MGGGVYQEFFELSSQFFCKSKTALKYKVYDTGLENELIVTKRKDGGKGYLGSWDGQAPTSALELDKQQGPIV